mmetsp:Transcript_130345/g.353726  ORF Transcript_130345/g.353726 Transcript_130345/m.353726 type:complete len:269 (-) Transcript_130345:185-991(-)
MPCACASSRRDEAFKKASALLSRSSTSFFSLLLFLSMSSNSMFCDLRSSISCNTGCMYCSSHLRCSSSSLASHASSSHAAPGAFLPSSWSAFAWVSSSCRLSITRSRREPAACASRSALPALATWADSSAWSLRRSLSMSWRLTWYTETSVVICSNHEARSAQTRGTTFSRWGILAGPPSSHVCSTETAWAARRSTNSAACKCSWNPASALSSASPFGGRSSMSSRSLRSTLACHCSFAPAPSSSPFVPLESSWDTASSPNSCHTAGQ